MPTITLRPDEDGEVIEWELWGAVTYHWEAIDDPIGEEDTTTRIRVDKNGDLDEDRHKMETERNVRIITALRAFAYGFYGSFEGAFDWSPNCRLWFNDGWLSTKRYSFPYSAWGWDSLEWAGLSGTQDDLDNLIHSVIAMNGMGLLDYCEITSVYIEADVQFFEDEKKSDQRINFPINHGVA